MKTRLIMGTKNQNFLNYLDKEIMWLKNKSKYFTYAGTIVILGHFLYKQMKNMDNDKIADNNLNNTLKAIQENK